MVWMMVIMFLPVLGLGLFFALPLAAAIPLYLTLSAISVFYHCLMMRAIRLPVQMGPEKMIGANACVQTWNGSAGQVLWEGELWDARTMDGSVLAKKDRVIIDRRAGLTLFVRQSESTSLTTHGRSPRGDACHIRGLLRMAYRNSWDAAHRAFEKMLTTAGES